MRDVKSYENFDQINLPQNPSDITCTSTSMSTNQKTFLLSSADNMVILQFFIDKFPRIFG